MKNRKPSFDFIDVRQGMACGNSTLNFTGSGKGKCDGRGTLSGTGEGSGRAPGHGHDFFGIQSGEGKDA